MSKFDMITNIRDALPRSLRRAVGMGLAAGVLAVITAIAPAQAEPTPTPSGSKLVITTVVGTGVAGFEGDGGPARRASLFQPRALATAPGGTLYIVTGQRIRAVDPNDKTIRTVAGTGESGFSGDGGPATKATFSESGGDVFYGLSGIAVGPDGTLYIADAGNHRIRAVDPKDGTIRTVAGSGKTGYESGGHFGGDGGPATEAKLFYPKDVAVGEDGTLYIADTQNYRVRAVDPDTGTITTIAGVENRGPGPFPEPDDGAPATKTFVEPDAVAVGPDGTVYIAERDQVYIADSEDDRVRAIDPDKDTVKTLAVGGIASGAAAPGLTSPTDLAMGDGVLYIATSNQYGRGVTQNRVYALDLKSGDLEEFAGGADRGALGDGGPPTDAYLEGPPPAGSMGVAYGPDGTVYIADGGNNRVRAVTERSTETPRANHPMAAQPIATLVGTGNQLTDEEKTALHDKETGPFYRDVHPLDEVNLDTPESVAVDRDGTLYIADTGNDRIRVVYPGEDTVHTLAGTAETPDSDEDNGDGGPADEAYLTNPTALVLGPNHRLYFIDHTGSDATIRVISLDEGTIDALGSYVGVVDPMDIAVGRDGTLYIADSGGAEDARVCKIRPGGDECEAIAGGDSGVRLSVELGNPQGLALDPGSTLYLADAGVLRAVRAIDLHTGEVSLVAGVVRYRGVSGDGGPATSAQIGMPGEMAVHDGTLYLTDEANHHIRAINLKTGIIQAVAGTGKPSPEAQAPLGGYSGGGFSGDGGPAGKAKLNNPTSVAVGPDGELYIADSGNNRIRVIGDVDISARGGFPIRTIGYALGGLALLALLTAAGVFLVRRRRGGHKADPDPRPTPPRP